tara:strand:- start:5994 stop:6905 length:912 start_codon:yes stop_codon:yes gene_type:complete
MIFDNEDCYNYITINETDNPIITSSDITVILMMEGSDRFKHDPFILSLSKKTVIQYNKGYKNCVKDEEVTATTSDLVHSYYTAFYYAREYNNVIILEEDAEMYSKNLKDFNNVNNFINKEDFNVFTFGSSGTFRTYKPNSYKNNIYTLTGYTFSQAQIFSKKARQNLYKLIGDNKYQGDIDVNYIAKLDKLYSYKDPLIVQLFPETDNKANWGKNSGSFGSVIGSMSTKPMKALIVITELDKDTTGWKYIYRYNRCKLYIDYLFIIIGIYLIIKGITWARQKYPTMKMKMKKIPKLRLRNYRK